MLAHMASNKSPLSRAELQFWQAAFLAAELPVLLKANGSRLSAEGAAHIAREYADAAVIEFRNVKNGDRS